MSKLPDPLSKEEVEEYRQDEEKEHNPSNTPAGCLTCALIATIDERDKRIVKLEEEVQELQAKTEKCLHRNTYEDYSDGGICGTPYCPGWSEYHCSDCGLFFIEDPCGCNSGESGWPNKRWKKFEYIYRKKGKEGE